MVKPIWILLAQETVSGSGISWAVCNSAPCSRQITMPAPHHSVFLQARCPSCRPTNSVKALKAPLLNNKQRKILYACGWEGERGFTPSFRTGSATDHTVISVSHWSWSRQSQQVGEIVLRRSADYNDRRLGSFACVRRRGAIAMRCKRCLNDIANRPIAIIHPRDY